MENEEGIPEGAPQQENETAANYHDRIRNEGDFAVGEVQKKDSYIGQLHEKVNTLKALEPFVEGAGGVDKLIELAIEGNQARTQAAMEAAQPDPDEKSYLDDIYDPDTRAIAERTDSGFAARDARIEQLESQIQHMAVNTAKSGLTENIGNALSDFKDHPDLEEKAREAIMGAVEKSELLAKSGDKSAVHNLEQLASDAGPGVLEMLTAGIYRELAQRRASPSDDESNRETIRQNSGDPASTTRSMLGTDKVVVNNGAKVTAQSVREVMEALAEKSGKDPHRLFG